MVELITTASIDAVEEEVPPPPRRRRRRHAWYESAETLAAFIIAWVQRGRMHNNFSVPTPGIEPRGRQCANLRKEIAAGLHAYLEEYLAETERLLGNNDQRGFHKHLKSTVGL